MVLNNGTVLEADVVIAGIGNCVLLQGGCDIHCISSLNNSKLFRNI